MSALAFNNSRVQQLRRLIGRRSSRYGDGRFVVEGPVLVAEAIAAGWTGVEQYVAADDPDAALPGAGEIVELGAGVLQRVGSTESPQAPIAVFEMRVFDAAAVLTAADFVVVVDRVSDPGNLGTIIRSAEAAGADAVVLTPGSVDPYGPKVVRSSAGALFHVPVLVAELGDVAAAGLCLLGTTSHDAPGRTVSAHTVTDLTGRIAIVMGNEAAGLPADWTDERGPIRCWVSIPHRGRAESLNVAMATTVLVFEAARQRAAAEARP